MKIRRAEFKDFGRIVEMGTQFLTTTPYARFISPTPEAMMATLVEVSDRDGGAIFVSEKGDRVTGFIVMWVFPHPYSGEMVAGELAWWVDPAARGEGLRLLRHAEDWAREQGVHSMQMIAPTERIGALYERLGYAKVETAYQRSL